MNECDVCGPHDGEHYTERRTDSCGTYIVSLCAYHWTHG